MPKISEMMESKYIRKEDVDEDVTVTIVGVKKVNIAREDEEPQMKWLIKFSEFDKPMVLNSTNIQLTARACGSEDTDEWKGKKVVLYVDENVSFQGKLIGGLRIRSIKKPSKTIATTANSVDEPDWGEPVTADEVGF